LLSCIVKCTRRCLSETSYHSSSHSARGVCELEVRTENAIKGVDPNGRGLGIPSRYFWEIGLPELESSFPSCIDRIAAGLVADCSAGDAHTSCDGDPRFHIYLPDSDFPQFGSSMQDLLDRLPADYCGSTCASQDGRANIVYSTSGFFVERTSNGTGPGFADAPESAMDWLRIPEASLFDICHGQVFYDPVGDFTERRRRFGEYYPKDAWLKRLAAACYRCGDLGQRLLPNAFGRGDYYTAQLAWWQFSESAMRLGFLLNRQYAPPDEWLYTEFCSLLDLSAELASLLWEGQCDAGGRMSLVQDIAGIYQSRIKEMGLGRGAVDGTSDSLVECANTVSGAISDPEISQLATWIDLVAD
jgi:hypothetical protein